MAWWATWFICRLFRIPVLSKKSIVHVVSWCLSVGSQQREMCNKRYMDPHFSMAFCSIYNIVYVNGRHLCCMYCKLVEILRTLKTCQLTYFVQFYFMIFQWWLFTNWTYCTTEGKNTCPIHLSLKTYHDSTIIYKNQTQLILSICIHDMIVLFCIIVCTD